MTDILVHRCELRIRRTGGWAWGASPDALIAAATRAIPRLLAARLPRLAVAGGEAITIARPVTVTIAATARQLAALGDGTPGTPDVAALRARIEADVAAAVAQAIAREAVATAAPGTTGRAEVEPRTAEPAPDAERASEAAARRAARTWWRSGTIEAVLARLAPGALVRLHALLLDGGAGAGEAPAALVAAAARIAASLGTGQATARALLQLRIAIAAGLIDGAPAVTAPQLRAAIDRVAPIAAGVEPAPEPTAGAEAEARGAAATAELAASAAPAICVTDDTGDIEIRSALPFLLLSSLHHAGWLDAAATLLAVHRREADAFALAAGLAAKVLDPVVRGWVRSGPDRLAIAVFAGRTAPIADAELSAAATRLAPVLAPLDAGLRAVLMRARRLVPLVLWRDDRGWHLVDTDGTVVLASAVALRDVLAAAPQQQLVIAPARCAEATTLEQLDYANLRFVTDAPPGRGETWRAFAGTTRRLYTNDTSTPAGKLAAATAHLDHRLALVEELAEVLAERPAIPRTPSTPFEATCTLAATCALADLGERLFPAEPTTPVLALRRFRDLDARVSFEPDRLRVRVPLGRRHADLMHHGVLGELADLPWLAGRTLELGGG